LHAASRRRLLLLFGPQICFMKLLLIDFPLNWNQQQEWSAIAQPTHFAAVAVVEKQMQNNENFQLQHAR